MESKNIKQSTVKTITPKGTWSNGKQTFNKYSVELANGDVPDFSAIGDFKKNVGDTIWYTLDEKKNYAKMQPTPQDYKPENSNMTQQESIARSVGINNACTLVATEVWKNATLEEKRNMLKEIADVSIYLYKLVLTKPE